MEPKKLQFLFQLLTNGTHDRISVYLYTTVTLF
jgi:hypothetical protein